MPQAVDSEFLLYTDDTLVFQHRDIKIIGEHLNRHVSTLADWFVDNKLSLHFGEDQTKSVLFSPKHRSKSIGKIDISYKDVKIKQHSKVTYLGCALDECLTGESKAMQVCTKVTSKLKFSGKVKTGKVKQVHFERLKEAFVDRTYSATPRLRVGGMVSKFN